MCFSAIYSTRLDPQPKLSMINRNSPISLYYQIAIEIRNRIARGEWKVSDQLPAEMKLAQEYQVSRTTLRQALAYLENEGILLRQRGIGTLIKNNPNRVASTLNFPVSFSRQMRELGFTPNSKILKAEIVSGVISENMVKLKLTEKDEIVFIERLFLDNNRPLAIISSSLPHRLCPGILKVGVLNDSLTTTLEKSFGLFPAKIDQRMRAISVSSRDAELLKVDAASAIFEITTNSQLEDGTMMEYAKTLCVGDRIAFHVSTSSTDENRSTFFEYVATTALPDKLSG